MAPPDKGKKFSKKRNDAHRRFDDSAPPKDFKAKSAGKKKFSSKGSWPGQKERSAKGSKPRAAGKGKWGESEFKRDDGGKPWPKGKKSSAKRRAGGSEGRFDGAKRRAGGSEGRFDGAKRRAGGSEGRFDGAKRRAGGSEGRFDGAKRRAGGSEGRFDGAKRRAGGSEGRFDGSKRRAEGSEGRFDGSKRRAGGSEGRFDGAAKDSRPRGEGRWRDKEREQPHGSGGRADYTPQLVATCALGLELTVGRELEALGLGPIKRDNAQVSFPYTPSAVAKSNYWLRTADRVWLQLGEFPAGDFEELFQGIKAVDWASMLPQDAEFPVEAISTKSKLESESAIQSVSKKAVVDRMQEVYGRSQFPETGARFAIRVFIVYNRARVFIDTSGEGLHRRGYRTYNAKAPLRETVAAGLVLLSHWSPERDLYDPMCGSGTILLEAASIGLKKAAGLERSFASQRWRFLGRECWEQAHQEALDLYDRRTQLKLFGSDVDGQVLKLARTHLAQADLEGRGVFFQARDVSEFSSQRKYGVVITNPPYGRRLNTLDEVESLTQTLAGVFEPLADTWSLYFYTGYEDFARVYGREPERVRKIYNGRLEANLLQYPGPKPPSSRSGDGPGGTSERVKRIPLSP